MEWALDPAGRLIILQSRPLTAVAEATRQASPPVPGAEGSWPKAARPPVPDSRLRTVHLVRCDEDLDALSTGRGTGGAPQLAPVHGGHEAGRGNRHRPRQRHRPYGFPVPGIRRAHPAWTGWRHPPAGPGRGRHRGRGFVPHLPGPGGRLAGRNRRQGRNRLHGRHPGARHPGRSGEPHRPPDHARPQSQVLRPGRLHEPPRCDPAAARMVLRRDVRGQRSCRGPERRHRHPGRLHRPGPAHHRSRRRHQGRSGRQVPGRARGHRFPAVRRPAHGPCADGEDRAVRPVNLGGFLSVMSQQILSSPNPARTASAKNPTPSSPTSTSTSVPGSATTTACSTATAGPRVNKNYITFSFAGGAANDVKRARRARAIGRILAELGFTVDTAADRVAGRFQKFPADVIEEKLGPHGPAVAVYPPDRHADGQRGQHRGHGGLFSFGRAPCFDPAKAGPAPRRRLKTSPKKPLAARRVPCRDSPPT